MYHYKQVAVDYFEQIPDEIFICIMGYLKPVALLMCARVNQRFHQLSQDQSIWRGYWQQHIKEALPGLSSLVKEEFISTISNKKKLAPSVVRVLLSLTTFTSLEDFKEELNQLDENQKKILFESRHIVCQDVFLKAIQQNNLSITEYLFNIEPYKNDFHSEVVDKSSRILLIVKYAMLVGSQEIKKLCLKKRGGKRFLSFPKNDPLLIAISQLDLSLFKECIAEGYPLEERDLNIACWYLAKPEMLNFFVERGFTFSKKNIIYLFYGLERCAAVTDVLAWETNCIDTFTYVLNLIRDNDSLKNFYLRRCLWQNHLEPFKLYVNLYQIKPFLSFILPQVTMLRNYLSKKNFPHQNFSCDKILSFSINFSKNWPREISGLSPDLSFSFIYSIFYHSQLVVYRAEKREVVATASFIGYIELVKKFLKIKKITDLNQMRDREGNSLLHHLCNHMMQSVPEILTQIKQELVTCGLATNSIARLIIDLIYRLIQMGANINLVNSNGELPGEAYGYLRLLLTEVYEFSVIKNQERDSEQTLPAFNLIQFKAKRPTLFAHQQSEPIQDNLSMRGLKLAGPSFFG